MATVDLLTAQGAAISAQPWQAYPRPQLVRDSFFCLNGQWEFSMSACGDAQPTFDETILVPFAPQSLLSGIHRAALPYLFYRKRFSLPEGFLRSRVLLHFGAVDQRAEVLLNGRLLGTHEGGYEPFCFDITDVLAPENTLQVRACDTLDLMLPYGKQSRKRGGMWYTPVSGIWQTVWLESVPQAYMQSLCITTGVNFAEITITPPLSGTVTVDGTSVPLTDGRALVQMDAPHLWSPEDPYLYRFTVQTGQDTVQSYFALRTLETKIIDGIARLCLNGKPYFFHGLLDQGYWSDGLFTPAAPSCYEEDILAMKKLGFNTLRKHIKVEPEQFYYDCDRLGMVVFQDMVNNGKYSFFHDTLLPTVGLQTLSDRCMQQNKTQRTAFLYAMEQTVMRLHNHPCICYWTIFNEGWGQFDSSAAYQKLRQLDKTRWIDCTSGWFRCGKTDVESRHVYFKKFRLPKSDKPVVLSEFGGYSYKPAGHVFNPEKTYGYRFFKQQPDFENALDALYREEILPAIGEGLCAAIYTQLSDVEDETNGLVTYDRAICKVSEARMQALAKEIKSR